MKVKYYYYYFFFYEEIVRISGFCQAAEIDFHRLAGLRNMSVDLKYDILCL